MEKLTPIQLEEIIENSVMKANKQIIAEQKLFTSFKNKWNKCKTKSDRFKCLDELFLIRKKLINEGKSVKSIDENWLTDLFSGGLGGFKSTFKEWISRKIVGSVLSLFKINDPYFKQALVIGLANVNWSEDWSKFLSPVKNCRFLSDLIIDSIAEYYIDKKAKQMFGGGVLMDSMRNAVVDSFRNKETIQKIQDIVEKPFCDFIQKMFGGGMVKNAISSMAGNNQPQSSPQLT